MKKEDTFYIGLETNGGMVGIITLERNIKDEYAARVALRKWQGLCKHNEHPFIVNEKTGQITRIVQWAAWLPVPEFLFGASR